MKYFYDVSRKGTAANIWMYGDTACTMLSTRGIIRNRRQVHDKNDGRRVCAMCQNNFENKYKMVIE
jgi:hypothetical protein